MSKLSDYSESEQESIIRNFISEEQYNPLYSRYEAQDRFHEEVSDLLRTTRSPIEVLSNELYLSAHYFNRDYWELYGEIEFRDEDYNFFMEAHIVPSENYGAHDVKFEYTTVLTDGTEDMSYGELADATEEITNKYDGEFERLVESINEIADKYGDMAMNGCEMDTVSDVEDFLEYNMLNVNLDKYLY